MGAALGAIQKLSTVAEWRLQTQYIAANVPSSNDGSPYGAPQMSKNLTAADWGQSAVPYTINLKNIRTGETKTMTVNAQDRLDAVIWCEKTLGALDWRAVR